MEIYILLKRHTLKSKTLVHLIASEVHSGRRGFCPRWSHKPRAHSLNCGNWETRQKICKHGSQGAEHQARKDREGVPERREVNEAGPIFIPGHCRETASRRWSTEGKPRQSPVVFWVEDIDLGVCRGQARVCWAEWERRSTYPCYVANASWTHWAEWKRPVMKATRFVISLIWSSQQGNLQQQKED